MKSLKESILDRLEEPIHESILGSNKAGLLDAIVDKIMNEKRLTAIEFNWLQSQTAVYKVNNDNIKDIIRKSVKVLGPKCSLNWIDVSDITDMRYMFYKSKFDGDISKWDVSNVEDMYDMFYKSKFDGDISKWDVSNVEDMRFMFYDSIFNGDISKWNVSKVERTGFMFSCSKFNRDISKWDVSNVKDMSGMFYKSDFNKDVSNWNIKYTCDISNMFDDCPIKDEYKPNF